MTGQPSTIDRYLAVLYTQLNVTGRTRKRVMAEVADHLAEAKERAMRGGADQVAAEAAAIKACGDSLLLARGFKTKLGSDWFGPVRRVRWSVDIWHARHPLFGAALALPVVGLLTLGHDWSFAGLLAALVIRDAVVDLCVSGRFELGYLARQKAYLDDHRLLNLGYRISYYVILGTFTLTRTWLPPSAWWPWDLAVMPYLFLVGWLLYWPRRQPLERPAAPDS